MVVDRRPGVAGDGAVAAARDHGVERQQELGDAPVVFLVRGDAARADAQAVVGGPHEEPGRPVLRHVADAADGLLTLGERHADLGRIEQAVQDADVAGVDAAFHALRPIVLLQALADVTMRGRHQSPFQLGRHRRHVRLVAEIGPDHPAPLDDRIGLGLHLGTQRRIGGLGGHVEDIAVNVELPAVVDAPQAAFLVASEPQIDQPVGAIAVEQTQAAVGVFEGDQVLAQHAHPHWRAIRRRQFFRQQHRHPEPPHQVAHQRAGTHAGQVFVVLFCEHRRLYRS